jgi:hypothetical protein
VKVCFVLGCGSGQKAKRADGINRLVGVYTVNELKETHASGVRHTASEASRKPASGFEVQQRAKDACRHIAPRRKTNWLIM